MNVELILADTGRQSASGGLHLLNVGWKATLAFPLPNGNLTLPEQAVVAFITAEFAEVNRVFDLELRLVDSEDRLQHFIRPDETVGAEVRRQVLIPQVPGASLGNDSMASVFVQFPLGTVQVDRAPGWYRWVCHLPATGDKGEVGFMVNQLPTMPTFGSPGR